MGTEVDGLGSWEWTCSSTIKNIRKGSGSDMMIKVKVDDNAGAKSKES